jgi:hypothetical protein
MRLVYLLSSAIAFGSIACSESSTADAAGAAKGSEVAKTAEAKGTNAPAAAANAVRTNNYRLLGILDPDRERMVAFALKIPSDWQAKQEFTRKWEGAVGVPQVGITLNSPDGKSQIVYFPFTRYSYSEGPMTSNLRAQKRAMGFPETSPGELAIMLPVEYLRKVILTNLEKSGITIKDLGNEQTAPEKRGEEGEILTRGSLDGTMPNGNRVRIEVRISHTSQKLGTDTYHSWSAVPSITQTSAGDIEAIHVHTRMAQDSIVRNPAWMKLEQEAMARGMQANQEASRRQHEATMAQISANTEAMTRAHEQRMSAIRQFGEANTANFNQRMADMDRQQRIRVDTIRGESKYVNPATGQQVKVEDGHKYVYGSQEHPNLYFTADKPIDTGALDWQELQKVQLQDY